MFSTPVLTTCLQDIEKDVAEVFTRNIFKEVKYKIQDASVVNVTEWSVSRD